MLSPLSSNQIEGVIAWARQAGELAMPYFDRLDTVQNKADQSFVTPADRAIDTFLSQKIQETFPNDGLVSEESLSGQNGSWPDRIWVIDPIDGTTAFSQGLTGWGIALGLLVQGQPGFGLFYMPLLDDLTYTRGSDEVYHHRRDLRGAVRTGWEQQGFLAVTAKSHARFQIDLGITRTMGSSVANLIYTARGAATATFLPSPHIWDLVAPAAILQRAGGVLRYLSGREIDYNELLDGRKTTEPVVGGHPDLLPDLARVIRPRLAVI